MSFLIPAGPIQLECELRVPSGNLRGSAVICHPHPVYGGTKDNRVVYRAAKAASEAGFAALRFNFRGVGQSTGQYDQGIGEQEDAAAAIQWLQTKYPSLHMVLIGYSFGAWVGLQAAWRDARIRAMIGIGLPLDMYDFEFLKENLRPALYLVGTQDEFCSQANWSRMAQHAPATSSFQTIEGADHYFSKDIEAMEERVAGFLKTVRLEG